MEEATKQFSDKTHTCVRCEHEGPVLSDFGFRVVGNDAHVQQWCRKCRDELKPVEGQGAADARLTRRDGETADQFIKRLRDENLIEESPNA